MTYLLGKKNIETNLVTLVENKGLLQLWVNDNKITLTKEQVNSIINGLNMYITNNTKVDLIYG